MNSAALQSAPMGLDDFDDLLADQPDDERWELINGRVVRMMVGARWEHNRIISNLAAALDSRFRASGSPCRTLRETFRLRQDATSSSTLPDLLVFCQRPPAGATFVTDAALLVEVLSEGTARRDRDDKWAVYQTPPGLKHYVLVSRDRPHVEIIDRGALDWSGHRIVTGLSASLGLPSFGLDIPLAEIYADVLG